MTRWRAEYDDGIWRFYRDGIELPFSVKGDIVVDALNKAESRIAEIEAECEQLRLGIHDETVPEKYEENVAKLQKEFSMRFENESPVEFYRTIRSGQYPQPPEVQE